MISDTINRVLYRRERVVLERQGKPVAAIVPLEDLELRERLEDALDNLEADRAEAESAGQPPIPWERIKAELQRP